MALAAAEGPRPRLRPRPIRDRATFEQLRRSGAGRRAGPLTVVSLVEPGSSEVRLGFAIGRKVGGAVVRNRLRRRLRAAVAELGPPPGAYLLIARPEAAGLSFAELRVLLADGLSR